MTFDMFLEHLFMVFTAVIIAISVGIPLGVLTYFYPIAKKLILSVVDLLQTIPSLALLGIIMVFIGAGKPTVITGLVLYSLLPIVRNTYLGLSEVSPAIKEAARGMGMGKMYRLIRVELPIAFPVVFTGVRIATVNSIGAAVFAAFVGGGGLGSIIYRGIRIQNMGLIISGTLTLMAMAVLFDLTMGYIERRLNRRSSTAK